MLFHIKNLIPNENLKIKIIAYSAQSLKTDFQKVDVCVNNSTVTTWEIGKTGRTYEAAIPYELVNDTKLKLSFIIREPIAYDTIIFFQLVIDYDK